MKEDEKKKLLLQIKSRDVKFYHSDVPDELLEDKDVIREERKAGIRKILHIGFDIINNDFFVEEMLLYWNSFSERIKWKKEVHRFPVFDSYYKYLEGEIYENACYYQCDYSKIKYPVNVSKMKERSSFITEDINEYKMIYPKKDIEKYEEGERVKLHIKEWVEKFYRCETLQQLLEVLDLYQKSDFWRVYDINNDFFLWQYVLLDIHNKNHFEVMMQYLSSGLALLRTFINPLCSVFDPDLVVEKFNYVAGVKRTQQKLKRNIKKYVEMLKKGTVNTTREEVYFDPKTHYYCIKDKYDVYRYFETIEELMKYRKNDISGSDLTQDIKLNYDFSSCKKDVNTKLPLHYAKNITYEIEKKYSNEKFYVKRKWYNEEKQCVWKNEHEFDYFFDFVAFLKGDLTGADLLECSGLTNLQSIEGMDFTNALLERSLYSKFDILYEKYTLDKSRIESFLPVIENEKSTKLVLRERNDVFFQIKPIAFLGFPAEQEETEKRISYITDIHLMHKLQNESVKSQADVIRIVRRVVNEIASKTGGILLIGGDVSSDFEVFKIFVRLLREELNEIDLRPQVIFVLGNHELWGISDAKFENIIVTYKELLEQYDMHLLQNELLYRTVKKEWLTMPGDDLMSLSCEELHSKLKTANLIFLGGIGFSGRNHEFNANNGIYRNVISREEEIEQSRAFEELYQKIVKMRPLCKTVIFTHMPMSCWGENENYMDGFIYVSGHTHRNFFFDNEKIRIYADNQIGYGNNSIHLKSIIVDCRYDLFQRYKNGIYKISREDYLAFYKGKNIQVTFEKDTDAIYMLKKNGYYLFICENYKGGLYILNGGACKRLLSDSIHYYYDNMDTLISKIKASTKGYNKTQRQIASEIKRVGGDGKIHGCIVDINFNSHIYINPNDGKITAYWASDTKNKLVYPSVEDLLKNQCPILYDNYKNLMLDNPKNLSLIVRKKDINEIDLPLEYLETDIYLESQIMKKIQRLDEKILTVWVDYGKSSGREIELKKDISPKEIKQIDTNSKTGFKKNQSNGYENKQDIKQQIETRDSLVGIVYGKLTIIEKTTLKCISSKIYKCRCSCGRIVSFNPGRLKRMQDLSCGFCENDEKLIGEKYGLLTIVRPAKHILQPNGFYGARWECLCECGSKLLVLEKDLLEGSIRMCKSCEKIRE